MKTVWLFIGTTKCTEKSIAMLTDNVKHFESLEYLKLESDFDMKDLETELNNHKIKHNLKTVSTK